MYFFYVSLLQLFHLLNFNIEKIPELLTSKLFGRFFVDTAYKKTPNCWQIVYKLSLLYSGRSNRDVKKKNAIFDF